MHGLPNHHHYCSDSRGISNGSDASSYVLDLEYDQVRGEILYKEPEYDLEKSYAYVWKVQSDRQVMGHSIE